MQENEVKATEPDVTKSPSGSEHAHRPCPGRHERKCSICNHPDRASIEFDFLNWRNPYDIVRQYHFRGLSTIYRHAHATGLFDKRRANVRFPLERIVERVGEVRVTAAAVIRAIRALSRINDAGEWVDPPSRVVVTHLEGSDAGRAGDPASPEERREQGQGTIHQQNLPHRSRPALIFDDDLLDEPAETAENSQELPIIDTKLRKPEIILTYTPQVQKIVDERRRAEAERFARESVARMVSAESKSAPGTTEQTAVMSSSLLPPAANAGPDSHRASSSGGTGSQPVEDPERSRKVDQNPTSLPQAVVPESAQSASRSPHRDASSALPPRESPATAHGSPTTGHAQPDPLRRVGSSGTTDPPFPFDFAIPPRRRHWRRF
jgi:hypothetical protein